MIYSKKSISVIIPIYNTPGIVLDECLYCLTHQNFENYELVCVDDCSFESETISVENKYEKEYPNIIKIFRLKSNVGAAEARNFGLNYAKGDYCIFLDSDDVFSTDLLMKLYKKIIEKDSDICLCGYSRFITDKNTKIIIDKVDLNFEFEDIKGHEDMLNKIPASGWNKLCRTKYLKDNNIKFQSLKSDNDMYFALKSVLCTTRICILHESELMLYRFNTDYQISANMNPLNMISAIDQLTSEIGDISLYNNVYSMIACYSILTGIFEMCNCKIENNAKKFYEVFKEFHIKRFPVLKNNVCNVYINYWKNNNYESRWFNNIGNYLVQLQSNTALEDKLINLDFPIYVWGRGKRGNAFELWCKSKNIQIEGICDEKNYDVGKKDEFNIKIVSTNYVESANGLVVATNHTIYKLLSNSTKNLYMIDLEDFCPL